MNHTRTGDMIAGGLFGACIATTMALIVVGVLLKTKQEEPEPQEPVVEVYEPVPWKGRMECRHGDMALYTVNGLVDFIVTAQPGGWMWEMFQEDGTVVLFHQPERVFCYAIAE